MNGRRVGSYEIVRTLAHGGMAVVHLARQPALDREVALKQLDFASDDPTLARRFVHEARLAAALDHPNVVTLFDFFEHGGVPYIAMEYVAGGSLRPHVGSLRPPQIFGVLEGVLAGLVHAEDHGIAHRDLKPENVLVARRGVKIADFGIARAYDALTPGFTSTGSAVGTPTYMAPEQALDERIGPYTDLYAVGVVAYELLAGRPPFAPGSSPVSVLYCHVHKSPPPLTELAPEVPLPVWEWVEWLLAKAPAERPGSAAEAWEALEEIVVDGLGPYWRRDASILLPTLPEPVPTEPTTLPAPGVSEPATTDTSPPVAVTLRRFPTAAARPSRRRLGALAFGATVVTAALAVTFLDPSTDPAAPARDAAAPFDFDGDGSGEMVLGMPGSAVRAGGARNGVVVIGGDAGPQTITASGVGVRPQGGAGASFGAALASADFDRDGSADLAVGTPGADVVAVLHGSGGGLLKATRERLGADDRRLPSGAGRYGAALAAGDVNGDGFADLMIGAPGDTTDTGGSGAVQIAFGSAEGLRTRRLVRRPDDGHEAFGSHLRAGDVDGDGHLDLVEGAPERLGEPGSGHGTYCPGSSAGPLRCTPLGDGATSALAVADVNGDRYDDIVQGDGVGEEGDLGSPPPGGEVRLWLGGRRGPAEEPLHLDQGTPFIRGRDEPGDGFGMSVAAGDLDADGFADIVVGAPGENEAAGSFTFLRGGRDGLAKSGSVGFGAKDPGVPGVAEPGRRFGASLALVTSSREEPPTLAVTVAGAPRLADAVLVFERGDGAFAPGEVDVSRLSWGRMTGVMAPRIDRVGIG